MVKALDRHIFIDGHFVSERISRIVEAITDYEPELEVRYIPERAREEGDAAFAIVHHPPNGPEYVLFYVPTEEEFDDRVLFKIIYNDQRATGKQQYSELVAWEETQALIKRQASLDALEEAHDIARFVLNSPLHTMKIDKNTTIRDYGGGRFD